MTVSEYRALQGLASQWRRTFRTRKAAGELEAVLGDIAALAGGPELLDASVYGATVPELREAAIAEGHALYGEDARLMIEHTGTVSTAVTSHRGRFTARVLVRCLNFPREDS